MGRDHSAPCPLCRVYVGGMNDSGEHPCGALPDGWTAQVNIGGVTITSPASRCMVTLDLVKRGYRGGMVSYGNLLGDRGRYNGRGWLQRLTGDAIGWLVKIDSIGSKPRRRA